MGAKKQTTLYIDEVDMNKFDKIASAVGDTRVALMRKVIRYFNEHHQEILKKIHTK